MVAAAAATAASAPTATPHARPSARAPATSPAKRATAATAAPATARATKPGSAVDAERQERGRTSVRPFFVVCGSYSLAKDHSASQSVNVAGYKRGMLTLDHLRRALKAATACDSPGSPDLLSAQSLH